MQSCSLDLVSNFVPSALLSFYILLCHCFFLVRLFWLSFPFSPYSNIFAFSPIYDYDRMTCSWQCDDAASTDAAVGANAAVVADAAFDTNDTVVTNAASMPFLSPCQPCRRHSCWCLCSPWDRGYHCDCFAGTDNKIFENFDSVDHVIAFTVFCWQYWQSQ